MRNWTGEKFSYLFFFPPKIITICSWDCFRKMKYHSQRCDVVVVGAGLAGICAAITAARAGALVSLVEARSSLGGRIGRQVRFPLEDGSVPNFAYFRETGLLDEILLTNLASNFDGTYEGRDRVLNDFVRSQERLLYFNDLPVIEAELNERKDKILSVTGIDVLGRSRRRFMAPVYLDCTGNGSLAVLAGAPGEHGVEREEYKKLSPLFGSGATAPESRFAITMEIRPAEKPTPFVVPSWLRLRWEDNESAARVAFSESFLFAPQGLHLAEWAARYQGESAPEASEIAYAVWDYIKNRSPFVHLAEKLLLSWYSSTVLRSDGFRIKGEDSLTPEELEAGLPKGDHIAMARAPLDGPSALLSSPLGRIALPGQYGIPLSCLYSQKVRNLMVAGEHASVSHRVSACLRHPPASAQLGEAVGLVAARAVLDRRQPRTLAKPNYVDGIRRDLARSNHSCGPDPVEDIDDLARVATVAASTTLPCCSLEHPWLPATASPYKRLLQFPVITSLIEGIDLYLGAREDCRLKVRLLEGASNGSTIPGDCLDTASVDLSKSSGRWVELPLQAKIKSAGWHFLEIEGNLNVIPFLQENAPVGVLRHSPIPDDKPTLRNPYSSYNPILPARPGPASGYCFRLSPKQTIYGAENIVDGYSRPAKMPHIWISEPTDFKFPEFLELHWEKSQTISRIDLVFDACLEYAFPPHPSVLPQLAIPTIPRSYKIYSSGENGHWRELLSVEDNFLGFRSHEFEPIDAKAIEIEISSTHGHPRAQVYQVRVYA